MTNEAIADNFSLLAKLMDIHGENSFKTKSYSSAAFTIEKLPVELSTLPEEKIFAIKGIGEAIGQKIMVQLGTGQLPQLTEYIANTPAGILQMLSIKGIGPKKISTIWKELEIETIGELLYACDENRLLLYKGFGAKTQQNIKESIEFFLSNQGSYLYAQIVPYAHKATEEFQKHLPSHKIALTGDFRRHTETISKLEWVTTAKAAELEAYTNALDLQVVESGNTQTLLKDSHNISLLFYHTDEAHFASTLFATSSNTEFYDAFVAATSFSMDKVYATEEEIFSSHNMAFIPPYLRERASVITLAQQNMLPVVIVKEDIKGIIHSHSKWSDGANTVEEMAKAARDKGLEYLVLSDHSKSAFYANGLYEERIIAQHEEIDSLNAKLAPFKIFKSIESDILNDGSLDYAPSVLASFDLIIASVHSNLKMNEEKAMARVLRAIENPYTNILGHMTGRLLLSRNGYPLDHKKIIEACAANNVVIELNAHPRRLDIDWRWIDYALEKNVLISIDPDAHAIEGFDDVQYGVLAAQKGGLTKAQNLSSFSLSEFEAFVKAQQAKR
ncbi:MAG: DNA polymerase/3'-5' exonuclease PolX [Filimonas sp.]|nr:DNA polymerase/3'-5' exonuclease PolX [Filimonas sp.]